jgi:hypothetical protein
MGFPVKSRGYHHAMAHVVARASVGCLIAFPLSIQGVT